MTYLIEEVSLRAYLVVFAVVVIGCGWLYSYLTAHGHGVNASPLGFLDGVFFSIVTVTSLGYGDLYPVGFSRVIAGAEVLFGLAFMGIMIAKVTSRRLSYHVQRLFVSDAQRRLDDFEEKFATMQVPLIEVTKQLGDKRDASRRVVDTCLRQGPGDDHARSVDSEMQLLPASPPTSSMFHSSPFTLAHDREARAVDEEMQAGTCGVRRSGRSRCWPRRESVV